VTADAVVVGAGAIGAATAYELARARLKVVLVEREAIASGASTHATGSFSLLGADFRNEAHLKMGLAGYRLARELMPELEALSGVETLYQRKPSLRLALDADEEGFIRDRPAYQEALVPFEWIDGDEVRKLEPRLSERIRGAAYEPETAQVDSGRFTLALATAAEKLGAELVLRRVTGLEQANGRVMGVKHASGTISAPVVVLAMGPWAAVASAWLGFEVPVQPLWGERALLKLDQPPLPAIINSPRRGHMIWRRDGLLSVGSTAGRDFDDKGNYLAELPESGDFVVRPTEAALMEIMQRAVDVFPAVEEARVVQQLAGYRPLAADRLPLVGPVPGWEGVYLATGHGTKGIHLAPATGRIVADLITRGATDLDVPLEPFLPSRFLETAAPAEERPAGMSVSED
jgi:glycine oxidase